MLKTTPCYVVSYFFVTEIGLDDLLSIPLPITPFFPLLQACKSFDYLKNVNF